MNPKRFPILKKYEIPETIDVPFSLEVTTKIPETYLETKWAKLEDAMCQIWAGETIAGGIQSLYKSCEELCVYNFSDRLCRELKSSLTRHILNDMPPKLESYLCRNGDDKVFLDYLENHWEKFCNQMQIIQSIFLYLECFHVNPSGLLPIWNWGACLLGECFMNANTVRNKLISIILSWIQKERDGECIQQERIRKFMKMFHEMGIYKEGLEKPIVEITQAYYLQQAETVKNKNDLMEYYEYIQNKVEDERNRASNYLRPKTFRLFHDIIEKQLIPITACSVIKSGLSVLLDSLQIDDIRKIYFLFSKSNVLNVLLVHFCDYVAKAACKILASKEGGEEEVNDDENERVMISLVTFYEQMQDIMKHSFDKNNEFHLLFKNKFESVLNKRNEDTALMFARFIDRKLKATQNVGRGRLHPMLDKVSVMLGYLQANTEFEKMYKKDLLNRLREKSTSIEVETAMARRIGSDYGAELSSSLKKIFDDFESSKDIMQSFSQSECFTHHGMEFNASVLSQAVWPRYPKSSIQFPSEMAKIAQEFDRFHKKNHPKRKIQWHPYLGECVITAQFPKGKYDFSVCPAIATVIMMFGQKDNSLLTVKGVAKSTKIEYQELKRILYTLTYGKTPILVHKTREKENQIHLNDEFIVNDGFDYPDNLIKIEYTPLIECPEGKRPKLAIHECQHTLDAAIVRIIKENHKVSHTSLIQQLKERSKFHIPISHLKERINELIDRGFIRRDDQVMDIYIYNP